MSVLADSVLPGTRTDHEGAMGKGREGSREKREGPIVTALSIVRVPDGWSVLTIRLRDGEVVSIDQTQPDMRAIAIEAFRMLAAKEFME